MLQVLTDKAAESSLSSSSSSAVPPTSFCTMTASVEGVKELPPIHKMKGGFTSLFKQQAKSGGLEGPSLLLTSENEITPPTSLTIGQPYDLVVYNFPHGSTVTINLIKATTDGGAAGESGITLFKLKDFDDNSADGMANVAWIVPNDISPGQYYMKATSLGLFTYSPLFDVASPSAGA